MDKNKFAALKLLNLLYEEEIHDCDTFLWVTDHEEEAIHVVFVSDHIVDSISPVLADEVVEKICHEVEISYALFVFNVIIPKIINGNIAMIKYIRDVPVTNGGERL